jgi:hypothetical protein
MKKITLLVLALTVALAVPSMAARVQSTMITHLFQVYQACPATSPCYSFTGYDNGGVGGPVISSAPGILSITPQDPGEPPWANYIGAAQPNAGAFVCPTPTTGPVSYTIKNTTLQKCCPQFVQCSTVFPARTITQQGTPNIRLWWPLMYETPSCTFTLTILYGTPVLFDDDGPGPNPCAWVHVEQWVWHVDATIESLSLLLELFHELPFGLDEVSLISDEPLYDALQVKLVGDPVLGIPGALQLYLAGDTAGAAFLLADFELEVMDACIAVSPPFPNPTGPGTGIANTEENPACCKLLVDVEYILQTTGIGQPGKKA